MSRTEDEDEKEDEDDSKLGSWRDPFFLSLITEHEPEFSCLPPLPSDGRGAA